MRYWILAVLLNGLLALVIHFVVPELFGGTEYYVDARICALIVVAATWRGLPGMLDNVLLFLFKWGIMASGLAFLFWGIGHKLEFWGNHNPGKILTSVFDIPLPNLALPSGIVILASV